MSQTKRNGTVEFLRLIAASGIVWFHSAAPGSDFAYYALPLFFVLLIALPGKSVASRPFTDQVHQRVDRLLRPWLIWSLIFAIAKVTQAVTTSSSVAAEFKLWMLLTGTTIHLWFLPFAFVCMLLLILLEKARGPGRDVDFWLVLGFAGAIVPIAAILGQQVSAIPLDQWIFAVPSLLYALAIRWSPGRQLTWLCFAVALIVPNLAAQAFLAPDWNAMANIIGVSVGALGVGFVTRSTKITALFSRTSMLVYLAHPIFLAGALLISAPSSISTGLIAIIGSFAFSFLMVSIRADRYLS